MSLSPHNCPPGSLAAAEFALPERRFLLVLAHAAILSAVQHTELQNSPRAPQLEEPRGVFTTIYLQGGLRGCVGYVFPIKPLYQAVIDTARASCFEDARFLPVSPEEATHLQVSLSVLSHLQPVRPETVEAHIEVGRHGLLLAQQGRRGLLLPQVPVEQGWDRIRFLEQTCLKAGLPAEAWRNGATIETFTAEVFSDRDSDPGA
jgi:AmmeMemoRadiSam system protein A